MNDNELAGWLLAHGGPAIRFRTTTELLAEASAGDLVHLEEDLLASPSVKEWLERLTPPLSEADLRRMPARGAAFENMKQIHHANDFAFENIMGKLVQYGSRAGMPVFDERTRPWREWLKAATNEPGRNGVSAFLIDLVASFLWMAGYRDGAVRQHVSERLERIAAFAEERRYDIYIDQDTYPGFPASYRKHKLIDQAAWLLRS